MLFGSNGNSYTVCTVSDICEYIYTCSSRYRDDGWAKEVIKISDNSESRLPGISFHMPFFDTRAIGWSPLFNVLRQTGGNLFPFLRRTYSDHFCLVLQVLDFWTFSLLSQRLTEYSPCFIISPTISLLEEPRRLGRYMDQAVYWTFAVRFFSSENFLSCSGAHPVGTAQVSPK